MKPWTLICPSFWNLRLIYEYAHHKMDDINCTLAIQVLSCDFITDFCYAPKTIFFFSLHIFFCFSSFNYFLNSPLLHESTLWTCKYQFCKLRLQFKHLRCGPAGLQGGFAARVACLQFADTCVRIRNATVLSYLDFALYKLGHRPLFGHRYTFQSAFIWFPWISVLLRMEQREMLELLASTI